MSESGHHTPTTRTLVFRGTPFHRDEAWRPMLMISGTMLLIIGLTIFLVFQAEEPIDAARELGLPVSIIVFIGVGAVVVLPWLRRHLRLEIDDRGIRYRNTLPLFSGIRPSWELTWDAITRVEYKGSFRNDAEAKGLRAVILHPQAGKARRLDPANWMDPDPTVEDFGLRMREIRFSFSQYAIEKKRREMALRSPLVKTLEQRGWPVVRPGTEATAIGSGTAPTMLAGGNKEEDRFDLTTHPGTMAAMGLIIGFLIYFVADSFFLFDWRYASEPPWPALISTGALGAVIGILMGRGAPGRERLVLALMLGGAVGAAAWPGALRLNASLAQTAPVPVVYEYRAVGEYRATEGDHPPLNFNGFEAYWTDPARRRNQTFHLLEGPLGIIQIDYSRIIERVQAFHATRPETTEPDE